MIATATIVSQILSNGVAKVYPDNPELEVALPHHRGRGACRSLTSDRRRSQTKPLRDNSF